MVSIKMPKSYPVWNISVVAFNSLDIDEWSQIKFLNTPHKIIVNNIVRFLLAPIGLVCWIDLSIRRSFCIPRINSINDSTTDFSRRHRHRDKTTSTKNTDFQNNLWAQSQHC